MGEQGSAPGYVPSDVAALAQGGRCDEALLIIARMRGAERLPGDLARAAQWVRELAIEQQLATVGRRDAVAFVADPARAIEGPDERYVLSLVDGATTVERLMDASTIGHFRTALALSALCSAGVLGTRAAAVARGPASSPPSSIEQLVGEPYVLVADASAPQAALTRTMLRTSLPRGTRMHSVVDGVEALEAARQAPPMLVVAEYVLPGIDGLELARRLREGVNTARTKVMLVAQRLDAELLRARLGPNAALAVRPIESRSLRELIARLDVGL
jgi:CheY-like chemotaxis protein